MAQLVEQLLPTPEVSGFNPIIGKFNCIDKTKLKKKRLGMAQFLKKSTVSLKSVIFEVVSCGFTYSHREKVA